MASAATLLKQARQALDAGRLAAASAFVEQALAGKLDARHGEALFDLGNRLAARELPAAAIAVFRRALQLFPGHPGLLINLGAQLDRHGDAAGAERCYRQVLEQRPGEIVALANLAQLLFAQDSFADALVAYDRLVEAAPDAPAEVWNNRGVCQQYARDPGAERSFRRALEQAPEAPEVLANLGFLLVEQRRYEDARPLLAHARALDPSRLQVAAQCLDLALQFADWTDFDRERAALVAAVATPGGPRGTVPPFAFLAICDDPALQQAAAKSFAWPATTTDGGRLSTIQPGAARRLRLGFAAAVFHDHPVPRSIADLLERLDRSRFEVFAYELAAGTDDAMHARILRAVDRFAELGRISTAGCVERMRADRIDVLFDLTGHTELARPQVFAARTAPVQVSYLGYAGTLGATYYDYLIGDAIATPAAERSHYTERVVDLGDCYFPGDPQRPLAAPPPREAYGLPGEAMVFVAQAAPYKILPAMFDLWLRLLDQVEDSVLWLRPMREEAAANLRLEARMRNVAPGRLVFAPTEPAPQYLARFRLADLYLDTHPFGSHTTVNDALFAGVPVVTLAGRSMASRASASQLAAVGLGELVADSMESYLAIALGMARDRARLRAVTAKLREGGHASALFDMQSYAQRFEAAVLRMAFDRLA